MLDSLRNALSNLSGLVGFSSSIEPTVALARDTLLKHISAEQPYGHVEEIYGTTVSERIGHKPISEGWRFATTDLDNGVRLNVSNVSEHVLAVLKGVPAHREPASGKVRMLFHWGAPHRWPQRDGGPPGERIFYAVAHPGTDPNPFLVRAKELARSDMTTHVRTGVGEYIRQLFTSMGLKER